jgi:hypothetical protein
MPIFANSRFDTKVHLKEDVFANFGSTLVTCTPRARKVINRTMRLCVKSALLCLALVGTAVDVALALENGDGSKGPSGTPRETADLLQQKAVQVRTLSRSEGSSILKVALGARSRTDSAFDCSHFVHRMYERAGFTYEYASSSDLYEGIDEFRRVANPQPGDLAVWRGHAGIVVDPRQRSFFSVLHSGPSVDYYDSSYWKRRGRPRFFRYIKRAPNSSASNPIRRASWEPMDSEHTTPSEISAGSRANNPGEDSSRDAGAAKHFENQGVNSEISGLVFVNSASPKPDQVETAFLQACTDSEATLRGRDLLKSAQFLVVFDNFAVEKVHLAGKQGWVDIQIDEVVSVTGGRVEVHGHPERQRWLLSRADKKTWKVIPAHDTIYLSQHTAERILAHELAQLTESDSENSVGNHQKAELARLLNLLFEK